jgi:O-antigen ligase
MPFLTSRYCERFGLWAVCALAFCVSLGAALVSISKLLILLAVIWQVVINFVNKRSAPRRPLPWTVWAVVVALAWMGFSFFWTVASWSESSVAMLRHLRFVWLLAVLYLIRDASQALTVLKWIVGGQFFVVTSSWLLWLGVPLPWATTAFPPEMGILFTSTLEQPVMSTLMLLLLWFFRQYWPGNLSRFWLWSAMALTLLNVMFIMTGRTGFLVMLLLIFLVIFWEIPKQHRWKLIALPAVLIATLMGLSPRFQHRMLEVQRDIALYQQGQFDSSSGQRIDYWHRSVLALREKPVLGSGVGSWKTEYIRLGGLQQNPPSNPHQQYLLWAVESGLAGLILFLGIFLALFVDAKSLSREASHALLGTTMIAGLMGMMNCPFFGVGMGEFFMVMMGSLLRFTHPVTQKTECLNEY